MGDRSLISEDLLLRIADLLNARPGICAADVMTCKDKIVHVRFRCRSFDALEEIVECANGANAGGLVVCESEFRSRYDSDPAGGMWFFLDIDEQHAVENGWLKCEVFEQMLK